MSARAVGILIVVILALAGVGATALFWIQNSARRVMLTLNLGVVELGLAEPVPVPVLMGICLASGFFIAIVLMLAMRMGGRKRRSPAPYDPYDSSPATSGDRGY